MRRWRLNRAEGEADARIATAFVRHRKEVKPYPLKTATMAFLAENQHGTTTAEPQATYENEHA